MYDIALSVAACARSGTRADVAWMIAPTPSDEALAFTPGGGRLGLLAGGAFDGLLADVAQRRLPAGRLVAHTVTDLDSVMCGLPVGTPVEFLVIPVDQFPADMWPRLLDREAVAVTARLRGEVVVEVLVEAAADASGPRVDRTEDEVTTVISPVPRLVVAGAGPIAEALAAQGRLLGWKVAVTPRPDAVAGIAATLTWMDAIVVMGHEVEPSSRCLMAALESQAGYVGALGSAAMQEARADWLAYREVTDLSRVHGPAGLAIGARGPAEIAVSIVAQILAERVSR